MARRSFVSRFTALLDRDLDMEPKVRTLERTRYESVPVGPVRGRSGKGDLMTPCARINRGRT